MGWEQDCRPRPGTATACGGGCGGGGFAPCCPGPALYAQALVGVYAFSQYVGALSVLTCDLACCLSCCGCNYGCCC